MLGAQKIIRIFGTCTVGCLFYRTLTAQLGEIRVSLARISSAPFPTMFSKREGPSDAETHTAPRPTLRGKRQWGGASSLTLTA